MFYVVGIKEVHIRTVVVEADSPEEARALADSDCAEIDLEYAYTLDPSEYTVEVDEDGAN